MTPEQREELKQAALAAEGWNWNAVQGDQFGREEDGSFYDIGTVDADQYSQGGEGEDDYNGTVLRFIAKSDPSAILSLIAQVEALTVPQWQPIETAPKDGTSILLYTAEGMIEACWSWGCWEQAPCYATYNGCGGVALSCDPTYWMLLPAAPTIPATPGTKEGA